MLIEENTQVKLENYRLKEEHKNLALDLEVLKKAFEAPSILGDQAG